MRLFDRFRKKHKDEKPITCNVCGKPIYPNELKDHLHFQNGDELSGLIPAYPGDAE
jgi:hypothetical protein